MTLGQYDGGHSSSQSARKSGRWDVHSSMDMDDRQVYGEDDWRSRIYNNRDLTKKEEGLGEGGPGKRREATGMREELGILVLRRRVPSPWDLGPSDPVRFSLLRTSRRLIRAQLPNPLSTNSL